MIELVFIDPILKNVRNEILGMVKVVEEDFDLQHSIAIRVTPSYVVGDEQSGYGFAAFQWHGKKINIFIGGCPLPDVPYDEWLDCLRESFCHELAHYEQYRDDKVIQERGVRVRTKSLLKQFGWLPA